MQNIITLLGERPYLNQPEGIIGWIVAIAYLLLITGVLYHFRELNKPINKKSLLMFLGLALLTVLSNLFIGLTINPAIDIPRPMLPLEESGWTVMIFSAIAWMLAGGVLGPIPATALGALSGLIRCVWDTHDPYLIIQYSLLALLFSLLVCQRNRSRFFQAMRQPLIAAGMVALAYPVIYLITTPFGVTGALEVRLDYAISTVLFAWEVVLIQLGIGGIVAQVVAYLLPKQWGGQPPYHPSQAERSLQARILLILSSLGLLFLIALFLGQWSIAQNNVKSILQNQMENAASTAQISIPYFLETGQNLIAQFATDPDLQTSDAEVLASILQEKTKTIPYFQQIILLNGEGEVIAAYPNAINTGQTMALKEQLGIKQALSGIQNRFYPLPPLENDSSARISFITPLPTSNPNEPAVIIGRTNLSENPLTKPVLTYLNNLAGGDAQGMLVDENHQILAHTDPTQVMGLYSGAVESKTSFEDMAPDGTRQIVTYQPINGTPWGVVVILPSQVPQQVTLQIALPSVLILLVLSVLMIAFVVLTMRAITTSLGKLTQQVQEMADGKLSEPISSAGPEELRKIRQALETLRGNFRNRIDEFTRLLSISRSNASNPDLYAAVIPILDSALSTGASTARLVFNPSGIPGSDKTLAQPTIISQGPARELYSDLDEQILAYIRQQDQLVIHSITRPRLFNLDPKRHYPTTIFAAALKYENQSYGVMWIAFDQPHSFQDEEIRFYNTLAGQATLAAANAQLFLNAEIGRQRLLAILSSNPDPVLVTDQNNRLILANPAALQILNLDTEFELGRPIDQVIQNQKLIGLLRSTSDENQSIEITLQQDKVLLATVSSVIAEEQRVGRVCVLRDVTRFKELDKLKSDFVASVSHDLRTPLTLMRGYATMLEMVGHLNDQQITYVRNIMAGVESMQRLVNNLLDLGRIETGTGLHIEKVPVYELVEGVIASMQIHANQKKIQLKADLPSQFSPSVEGDPALLQQALHNLVDNAIKFNKSDGKVTVRVHPLPERLLFEVTDTGIGISPVDQTRLFEKFYRTTPVDTVDGSGSGLGLPIVHSIAERHKGQIWVESQLGKGSTFFLAIPYHQSSQAENER